MDNGYVAAAEFKANCLRLMDEVARQRRPAAAPASQARPAGDGGTDQAGA